MAFLTANIKGKVGKQVAEYFGVDKEGTLLAISPLEGDDVAKYLYTGAWNDSDVKVWVQAFLDGKIERHFKSDPIPAQNNEPVKVIVGKNYEQVVQNPNAFVLVEHYAPWCGHCKKVQFSLFKHF